MSTGYDSEKFYFEVPTTYRKRYLRLNNNVILKSKENIKCSKCTQSLIKKLTKYKLRKDAIEDPDIIDISNTFHLRLQIKSPTKGHSVLSPQNDNNNIKLTNYLFKMVRHKNSQGSIGDNGKNKCKKAEHSLTENSTNTKNNDNANANAFHIMMNSRNKVIGSNSPGKDKKDDNSDTEDKILLKATKLKRTQALQKMAESKGSLLNKDKEEYKDDYLKKKMDKRAEKFKEILTHGIKQKEKIKSEKVLKKKTDIIKTNNETMSFDDKIKNKTNKPMEIISLIDIDLFNPPKEEEVHDDFYDKLSPSLKHRDMLCYYKKVEKQLKNGTDNNANSNDQDDFTEVNDNIIKVKLMSRKKKKKKNKKELNTEVVTEIIEINETSSCNNMNKCQKENHVCETNIALDVITENRKRKRKNFVEETKNDILISDEPVETSKDSRPKRNTKKLIKYDSFSSSDDEFLIFTPKKKKPVKHRNSKNKEEILHNKYESNKTIVNGIKNNKNKQSKSKQSEEKDMKLAPIFVSKPQTDLASLEAKKKFLQSGVPEQIRKMQIQASKIVPENLFFVTKHVQQLNTLENHCESKMNYYNNYEIDDVNISSNICSYSKILSSERKEESNVSGFICDVTKSLQIVKESYPEFPVYRTYHLLKNKCCKKNFINVNFDNSSEVISQMLIDEKNEDPMTLNWTEKYRIPYAKDIIGNFEGIKELKRWLQSWQENEAFTKKNRENSESDSSDFCYYSDTDSRDSMRGINNILIITGPSGCGKTSSVYAVATELSMKVIEVNVSSKRTGKIILQDLQEATQSHKVNRTKGTSSENSQDFIKKAQNKSKDKLDGLILSKKKRIKTYSKAEPFSQSQTNNQEINRTEMSLILIDDADIIFDQDDGFVPALSQIVQCSKRPVILVTSLTSCQHLNKFYQCGNIVKMASLSPRILGTWLDIMCVSDTKICWPGIGAKCLDFNKGDIRKTINYLNYLVLSKANGELENLQTENTPSIDIEDESSSLSWLDNEINIKRKVVTHMEPSNFLSYINANIHHYFNTMSVWWNIPNLITKVSDIDNTRNKESLNCSELIKLTNVLDCLSVTDILINNDKYENRGSMSDPWQNFESDGVSENENFIEYNSYKDIIDEINHTMVKSSLLELNPEFDKQMDICLPETKTIRAKDKKIMMHHSLTSSFSNGSILDRRSLATDYWSICRNICRIERDKIDTNSKRNNRFCHYLKSMKTAKNDSLEKLCDSLQSVE